MEGETWRCGAKRSEVGQSLGERTQSGALLGEGTLNGGDPLYGLAGPSDRQGKGKTRIDWLYEQQTNRTRHKRTPEPSEGPLTPEE